MAKDGLVCWNCGTSLEAVPRPISRHEQCPACFEALHCCRLCRHYRPSVTGHCDEDRADPPVVKENANFCDWFRPSNRAFSGSRPERSAAAQDRLQALFGEPDAAPEDDADTPADHSSAAEPLSPEAAARAKLDDLFSKG
ncbi:MAG: hypothetical protein AB7I04_13555 [Pseudomonadales bacterium]